MTVNDLKNKSFSIKANIPVYINDLISLITDRIGDKEFDEDDLILFIKNEYLNSINIDDYLEIKWE